MEVQRLAKHKKTDPRRIPCTQADVNRARHEATDLAIKCVVKMILYILLDKHDAPPDEVQQLADEIKWLSKHITEGKMSWSDVDRVLKEYEIKYEWT